MKYLKKYEHYKSSTGIEIMNELFPEITDEIVINVGKYDYGHMINLEGNIETKNITGHDAYILLSKYRDLLKPYCDSDMNIVGTILDTIFISLNSYKFQQAIIENKPDKLKYIMQIVKLDNDILKKYKKEIEIILDSDDLGLL